MSDVAGKFSDAEVIARKAHIKRIHVLGVDHPDTLTTASNLASILAYQCKFTEAEAMLTTVLATSRRVLGPAHPNTVSAEQSFGLVQVTIPAAYMQHATHNIPMQHAAPAIGSSYSGIPSGMSGRSPMRHGSKQEQARKQPVKKLVSRISTPKLTKPLSVSDAKSAGFTIMKRRDKGVYEKL